MRKPCLCSQNIPLYITSIISPTITTKTHTTYGKKYAQDL